MTRRLQNPDDIELMRLRLFSLPEIIVLSAEQHAEYWPYVTNIWTLNKRSPRTKDHQVEYYLCRRWYKEQRKSKGTGERKKTIRVVDPCGIKLKVTTSFDDDISLTPTYFTLERTGNCHEHNHDLESMDAMKRNQKIKQVAAGEVANGYTAATINKTLHSYHRPGVEEALIAAGGHHLSRYDVHNAGSEWKKANPDQRLVGGVGYGWEEQQIELADWLETLNYRHEKIEAIRTDGTPTHATVFAPEHALGVLRLRGHLTLMDSTHDTNWLGWYLYTVLVRDGTNSWRPCAHILAQSEDGDILAACLKVLKK